MNKRGFTLIELLIVIAVIVILMGIAIAVSGPLMAKAENNACASMIQKILGACEKFKTDFGAYPGELSALKTRNTARQAPRWADGAPNDIDNNLGNYLFTRFKTIDTGDNDEIDLDTVASGALKTKKTDPGTWHGEYLDNGDIAESFIKGSKTDLVYTILDYWQEKPLVYWLRYKNGNSGNTGSTGADALKKKLTPELWSIGSDGHCGPNDDHDPSCLKLVRYPDLKKCTSSHTYDEDNVGGDLNTMKK